MPKILYITGINNGNKMYLAVYENPERPSFKTLAMDGVKFSDRGSGIVPIVKMVELCRIQPNDFINVFVTIIRGKTNETTCIQFHR